MAADMARASEKPPLTGGLWPGAFEGRALRGRERRFRFAAPVSVGEQSGHLLEGTPPPQRTGSMEFRFPLFRGGKATLGGNTAP